MNASINAKKFDLVTSLTSHFVGRQKELGLIWNQYEVMMSGCARVVLLPGELGIGKTRLLNEVASHASHRGAIVLRGGASEFEGMPPYLPFLEALGQYIRRASPEQLGKQIAGNSQILTTILPELADLSGQSPSQYPLPPEQARLRLYEAIGTFLEAISAQCPLVLMLDDLHWADTASLDLLCHIARHQSTARILILGTYREGEIDRNPALGRAMNELVRQRVLAHCTLKPLTEEETEKLAISYLGGPVSQRVRLLLYQQSEGNPFFAEELIRGWLEAGDLVQYNSLWTALTSLERALPASIVGTLRQRFARLSSEIIDHLRVASIIGRTFDLPLLATVAGRPFEIIEEQLLEAIRAGLVRADDTYVFTFNHDKIRECLYTEVSNLRRRRLHEAIGQALEARYIQENTKNMQQLAELAFHFTQCGDRERGVAYSQQAAEHAYRSSAFKEAVIHYNRCLELLHTDDERRGNLLLSLGEAALLADAENEAVTAYKEALALFSQTLQSAAAQAAHGLALAYWRQESLQVARTTLEHALALSSDKQTTEVVRILVDLSTLLTNYMDHQVEGMTYAQRALEIACRLKDNTLEAAASRAVAGKLYAPGNSLTSVPHSLERAVELAEASDASSEAAECCFSLARAYYWLAEIRQSYAVSYRMMEFIEVNQHPYQLRNALSWLALLHTSQGAWAEAEQIIAQAQPIVEHLTSPFPTALLHQFRGFLAYQQEDYEMAEREFQTAMVDQPSGSERLMFFTGLPALTQVALGKKKEAYAYSARLELLLSELPPGALPTAPIVTCLALMAIALDNHEQAANYYPILQAFRGQHYWFLVDRVLGQLATLLKDWDMALVYLTAAKETAQREKLRPELARTLQALVDFEIARGGEESANRATILLKQAIALFHELHMSAALTGARNQLLTLSQQPLTLQLFPADLTRSEVKVLQLVARGKSNRQIGIELGISEKTVANHLTRIFAKTASENRAAATAFAIRHRIA